MSKGSFQVHMIAAGALGVISGYFLSLLLHSNSIISLEKECSNENDKKKVKYFGIRVPTEYASNTREVNTRIKKRLHLVRHAQGWHNFYGEKNHDDYMKEEFLDAELTQLGLDQCATLCKSAQKYDAVINAQILVVSPLRRTLQTATSSFPFLKNKIPWLAVETCREATGEHPCDKRLSIKELSILYPHVSFGSDGSALVVDSTNSDDATSNDRSSCVSVSDLPLNHPSHNDDSLYNLYAERRENDIESRHRSKLFLKWIFEREEDEIVVVTHSAFLRSMLSEACRNSRVNISDNSQGEIFVDVVDVCENEEFRRFHNCEMRTYDVYTTQPKTGPVKTSLLSLENHIK